jgi:hypothetical protein
MPGRPFPKGVSPNPGGRPKVAANWRSDRLLQPKRAYGPHFALAAGGPRGRVTHGPEVELTGTL